jgi:hypothetical protein
MIPTSFPTRAPTFASSPTAFPSVTSLRPSTGPTQFCPTRTTTTDVVDLIQRQNMTSYWIEGGFANIDDKSWVRVTTKYNSFMKANIFISLPNIPGETSAEGYPAIARVRNVVSSGQVSFETKIYQANDSYCSKQWYIPSAIVPGLSMSWLVVEHGAYNLTKNIVFIIGDGAITRQDSVVSNTNNFIRFNFPVGCTSMTLSCGFSTGTTVGIILQLQTLVYDRLLIPRISSSALRFFRAVLQPHDSSDSSYYVMLRPETLAYMAFTSGVSVGCVEGLAFDSNTYSSVTNTEVQQWV